MKSILFGIICIFFTLSLEAQESSTNSQDITSIKEVVEMYFDGWLTGDTTLIGTAMHSTCHLKFTPGGEFGMRNRTQYLSGFRPRPRLENASGRIMSIDITGNVGSVKCELETEDRIFTDYFNMMRLEGRWYIMDKVSTNVAKE